LNDHRLGQRHTDWGSAGLNTNFLRRRRTNPLALDFDDFGLANYHFLLRNPNTGHHDWGTAIWGNHWGAGRCNFSRSYTYGTTTMATIGRGGTYGHTKGQNSGGSDEQARISHDISPLFCYKDTSEIMDCFFGTVL
jgi:hypothetical protein